MAESAPAYFLRDKKSERSAKQSQPQSDDCAITSSDGDPLEIHQPDSRLVPILSFVSSRSKMSVILCTGKWDLEHSPRIPWGLS